MASAAARAPDCPSASGAAVFEAGEVGLPDFVDRAGVLLILLVKTVDVVGVGTIQNVGTVHCDLGSLGFSQGNGWFPAAEALVHSILRPSPFHALYASVC